MKIKTLFLSLPVLLVSFYGTAQVKKDSIGTSAAVSKNSVIVTFETRPLFKRKGQFFCSWGYNRAFFSNSDIHLTGTGYDFSISNVTARDEHGGHDFLTYIKPTMFTIPQFNWRIGYYLNDKTFITIGHDHMKYNMDKQVTLLTGKIKTGVNDGTYNNAEVLVGENVESAVYLPASVGALPTGFVSEFEHCDGLNDFTGEIGRIEQLWCSKNCKHAFSALGAVGLGMIIPDSDTDILGQPPKHDMQTGKKAYHLAGYSCSASIGLQFDFFKHFFIQGKIKAGYMNLPDINTTVNGGKASQHFNFIEPYFQVGYTHSIGRQGRNIAQ